VPGRVSVPAILVLVIVCNPKHVWLGWSSYDIIIETTYAIGFPFTAVELGPYHNLVRALCHLTIRSSPPSLHCPGLQQMLQLQRASGGHLQHVNLWVVS